MRLLTKNWGEFQHYKDRSPPWIKLHKSIMDDRKFMGLPVASKAIAPLLWLIASETKDGSIEADYEDLSFRLRMSSKELKAAIDPLLAQGFFLVERDASNVLADGKQDGSGCFQVAVPEERREEGETEKRTERESEENVCTEPQSDSVLSAFSIPLNNNTEHPVLQSQVDEWSKNFPAVDVEQELRNMRAWSTANTEKRKTKRGVNAFIVRWLSGAQDKAPKSVVAEFAHRRVGFTEGNYQRQMRERMEEFAPDVARKPELVGPPTQIDDMRRRFADSLPFKGVQGRIVV